MVEKMKRAGVRFYMRHALTGIFGETSAPEGLPGQLRNSTVQLLFANGARVQATAVVLNLPRKIMQRLHPDSLPFKTKLGKLLLRDCTPCPGVKFEQPKVYAIYEDPWWLTKLGISE